MKSFRYRLGKKTGRCPACGRHTFKYYIDTLTGEIADPACGRCNREINCRYHCKPTNPQSSRSSPRSLSSPSSLISPAQPCRISGLVFRQSLRLDPAFNSLLRYMAGIFGLDRARRSMELMDVGSARAFGGSPVFWLRDRSGEIRSGKVMAYDPATGHRIKTPGAPTTTWVHTLLGLKKFRFEACFFGEYNAARHPGRRIVVVESEKTAVMIKAALLGTPGEEVYEPVATGGASNLLNVDPALMLSPSYKLRFLYGRHVTIVPDADMVDRWRASARAITPYCESVSIVDVTDPPYSLTGSADIADYLAGIF